VLVTVPYAGSFLTCIPDGH